MKVVILGSGHGSNARAILESQKKGNLGNAIVVGIVSDRDDAGILEIADQYSIPSSVVKCSQIKAKLSDFDKEIFINKINVFNPDLIVLAGFMKILPSTFIEYFQAQIINIHPSLLPCFKGINAIQQAFDHGVKISGCTVHQVSTEVDSGKILAQAPVRIMDSDTIDTLTQKIHAAEHVILPSSIADLSLSNRDLSLDK